MKDKQRMDYSKKFDKPVELTEDNYSDEHISEDVTVQEAPKTFGHAKLERNDDKLVVRSGPGLDHEPVKHITNSEEFMILDDSDPDWYKIILSYGVEGFVMKMFVEIL